MKLSRYWIGVASKDHVLRGVEGGFCQLCHGKSNPLKRLSPGDWIIYYSPRDRMGGGEVVQSFTAMGRILEGEPHSFDMGNGFVPYRRNVQFVNVQETPIRPLLDRLSFIKNKQSWGYVFRFGWLEISESDLEVIATAMKAALLTSL